MRTKIFQVIPETLAEINTFIERSTMGTIMREQFDHDEKGRLYLIITILEAENGSY